MFGFEHWNLEPDIITLAKSLSGGYVPCGAIVTRREIYQKTFSRMDRCVVHSTTFGRNNLAMACGLAALEVIDDEKLVENSARMGALLMEKIDTLRAKHSFIKEVRGKGLMIAIEFHEPTEFKLKMAWKLLHKVDKVLFAQMVVTQMLSKHRILTQVAGHAMDVVKILPPLIIGEREIDLFVCALDDVLTECRKFPGANVGNRKQFCAACARLKTRGRIASGRLGVTRGGDYSTRADSGVKPVQRDRSAVQFSADPTRYDRMPYRKVRGLRVETTGDLARSVGNFRRLSQPGSSARLHLSRIQFGNNPFRSGEYLRQATG